MRGRIILQKVCTLSIVIGIIYHVTSCSSSQKMIDLNDIVLHESSADTSIAMKTGQHILFQLRAMPGTGFSWNMVKHDENILQKNTDTTFERVSGETVGGEEIQSIRLKAISKGSAEIELHYKRAWEKDAAPAKTLHFRVTVIE